MAITVSPTGAFVGRNAYVEFSLDEGTTFLPLGCLRGKELNLEWDEVDTTSDSTVGNIREALVTFKSESFSFDGVSSVDSAANQQTLYDHVRDPSGSQPTVVLKFVDVEDSDNMTELEGLALITTFNKSRSYDAEATFTLEGKYIANPTSTSVAIP